MRFRIRVLVHTIVCTKYFEMAVMLVILLSSISLAAENPVEAEATVNVVLHYTDYVFTAVFTVELVLKVNIPNGYCSETLNYIAELL